MEKISASRFVGLILFFMGLIVMAADLTCFGLGMNNNENGDGINPVWSLTSYALGYERFERCDWADGDHTGHFSWECGVTPYAFPFDRNADPAPTKEFLARWVGNLAECGFGFLLMLPVIWRGTRPKPGLPET